MPRTPIRPGYSGAVFALVLSLPALGCNAYIKGDGPAGGDPAMPPAMPVGDQNSNNSPIGAIAALGCDPVTRGTTELAVRRLTKPELIASLNGLFGSALM